MSTPRYSKQELWNRIRAVAKKGGKIYSLTKRFYHRTVLPLDETEQQYDIEYKSGNRSPRSITLEDLYALYRELYLNGSLTNSYMRGDDNLKRVLGWTSWHAPSAAMFAILPLLDDNINVRRGELHIQ